MKKERKMKTIGFTRKILDDFHDFVSECVSFPRKINNPFFGVTFFRRKVTIFILRETKTQIFSGENRRKTSLRSNKMSIPSVPISFASPDEEWTSASSTFQELHSDVGSDGSAHGWDMSGWPSQWPWQRERTTPHEDRRLPLSGCWGTSWTIRRRSGTPPTPQPELFSLYEEEPGGSRPDRIATLSAGARSAAHAVPFCAFSRWSCAADGGTRSTQDLAWGVRDTQLAEQLMEVPTIVSCSSLLQRTVEQHVDTPVPRRGGRKVGLQDFLPRQSSSASSSSPAGVHGSADRPGARVFRTFPNVKKKCDFGLALGVGTAPRVEPIHARSSCGHLGRRLDPQWLCAWAILEEVAVRPRSVEAAVGTALMAAWWLRVCWCGSLLVAERQERSWLVRSLSWSTLLHSGLEQLLVQTVHGCCLSVLEAYGRISCSTWSPRRAIRTWNLCNVSVSLYLAVLVLGVLVLLLTSTKIGFWGDAFFRGCNT